MTPEEWHKVKEVLQTALELDPPARETFLDSACAGQESMRSEVESLLKSHEQDDAFLEDLAAVEAADLIASTPGVWIGRRLGPYELLEEIGEGGMGAVYRAVRADGMYDKQVAIKLIRSGLSTGFFFSRFRNERQILAGLEHPNIARLLDGGVTEEGMPFVVLEFVPGVPIDEYCIRHDLSIPDRLKLFRTVCSAVQYAHQNLVVHRDLKPGNILVTEDGVPKLLDFGIAKILDPEQEGTGENRSLTVMRIMTPDFASPEQVRGDVITTASDVYSLGVILYLLLSGRRPYRVSSTAPHEIIRAICDTDPEKPSTAVMRLENLREPSKSDSPERAPERKSPDSKGEKFRRALSGDLDNIVLKALRKEPERRYATVEQFSEDVRRHLEHLPVIARKDTPGYRASKFVMRHKASVAATVVVAFTLIAALLITLREARIAQRRFNDVRSLANSLIFDVHDSIKDLPGSTPARKVIVDRALQYLNALNQESGSDLSLQRELATAYERVGLVQGHYLQNSLGDTQGSLISYQKALAIRNRVDAKSSDWNDRLALAQAHRLVANQQWATGNNGDAAMNIATAVTISEALSIGHPKNLKILHELRFDYKVAGDIPASGNPGGAEDYRKQDENHHKAITTDELMLALSPDDFDVQHAYATDLVSLGVILTYHEKDLTAALACFKKELGIDQKLRERSADTRYARGVAVAYSHLGQAYDRLGDTRQSLENFAQGLEVSRELALADPQNTLFQQGLAIAYANTANELGKLGRDPQSLDYIEKSDQIMRTLVASAPENKQQQGYFAAIVFTNGVTFGNLGKLDAALKDLNEARVSFESLEKTDSLEHGIPIRALTCTEKMGEAASRAGNSKLAANYFHQVLKEVEPELARHNADANVPYLAADSYSGLGDLESRKARQSRGNAATQKARWTQARVWYLKSMQAWRRVDHPLPVAPSGFDAGDPAKVETKLQLCEAALAKFGAPPQ
jgi:eukaryotic-like serine/threonine-protein kinase